MDNSAYNERNFERELERIERQYLNEYSAAISRYNAAVMTLFRKQSGSICIKKLREIIGEASTRLDRNIEIINALEEDECTLL